MEKAITVTQLSTYIKQIFEAEEMLSFIKVIGEVSGLTIAKGIAYFTLKDENAQLSCVCFSPNNFDFKNGDKIYATGSPRYYVKGGKLNFNVSKIEQVGLGELYQRFLELKEKLQLQGYFDEDRKKLIPKQINRIGVVTSAEGAVIQDIINVRNRRNPKIDIVLYPTKVQGIGAEFEIAEGIDFFDNYNVDVVIVGRGGGSLEDLMPFNTEVIANAIYKSKKPIVSAVGHETDFTICDFVADLRAPTPSAASEILCEDISNRKQNALMFINRIQRAISVIKNKKSQQAKMILGNLISVLNNDLMIKSQDGKTKIYKLDKAIDKNIEQYTYNYNMLSSKLEKLNPEMILKMGYAALKKENSYISSINNIAVGDNIDIVLRDGVLSASVLNKGENNGI